MTNEHLPLVTGLAMSAPIYTLPNISAFSPTKSAKSHAYTTESQKLTPSDRLTLFRTVHAATGAITIPVSTISAAMFAVAAYFSPVS